MIADEEHESWVGPAYDSQPTDGRLLIVGFSHWLDANDPKGDRATFTRELFEGDAVSGGHLAFFNAIAGYFGEGADTFWQRVAFANSLPTAVGFGEDRYGDGTPDQRAAVAGRALRLIEKLKPGRVLVFSRKAWRLWPDYTGMLRDGTLRVDGQEFDCGTYRHADGEALAFGLRHPQGATSETMRAVVAAAMEAKVTDLRPRN